MAASEFKVGAEGWRGTNGANGAETLTCNTGDATRTSLTLTNVTRTNSGSYALVVTNEAGNVSSSNAVLTVHVPQRLTAPVLPAGGSVLLTARDREGGSLSPADLTNFQAQASTNLADWAMLPGALTLTNELLQPQDSDCTNCPVRFYRIVKGW